MLFDGLPNEPMPGQVPAAPAPQQPQQPSGPPAATGQQLHPEQQLSQQRQRQLMQEVSRMRQAQEQQLQPKPQKRSLFGLGNLLGGRKEEPQLDYRGAKEQWHAAQANEAKLRRDMEVHERKMQMYAEKGHTSLAKKYERELARMQKEYPKLHKETRSSYRELRSAPKNLDSGRGRRGIFGGLF